MPGPSDVRSVGFAGADGVSTGRRRLRLVGRVLGVVLLVVGVAGIGWGIWTIVDTWRSMERDAVAVGRAAPLGATGETFGFTASGRERFTIWVDTGTSDEDARDVIVDSITCQVRTGGSVTEVDGARQGSRVTLDRRSTVGSFTASEGRVEVRCAHGDHGSRYDRGRLAVERKVLVVPGEPGAAGLGIVALIAGGFLAVAGGIVLGVSRRSR
ncbi:MAG: hypothetical protein KF906_12100 [Actinobacteria bacterium]|nr:hypothetical protein [Actinomycetota bacterium]